MNECVVTSFLNLSVNQGEILFPYGIHDVIGFRVSSVSWNNAAGFVGLAALLFNSHQLSAFKPYQDYRNGVPDLKVGYQLINTVTGTPIYTEKPWIRFTNEKLLTRLDYTLVDQNNTVIALAGADRVFVVLELLVKRK